MKKYIGKYVKINLKNEVSEFGKIIALDEPLDEIIFLPHKNENVFNQIFKNKTHVLKEEIATYTLFLKYSDIENNITELDTELKNIRLENAKNLPSQMRLILGYSEKPCHLNLEYQIDDNSPVINIGEYPIINGEIILPLKLAFISYAKEDRDDAIELMNKLHDKGILTWFDEKDLLPGDSWEDKIEIAIEKSDYFIALFSKNTINKHGYKQRETEYALKQKSLKPEMLIYIIPILLDECIPPRSLSKIHWLKKSDDNWFDRLLLSLGYFRI